MERIDPTELRPDEYVQALKSAGRDAVIATGYVVDSDRHTVSISRTPRGSSWTEYPVSGIEAAFIDEDSRQATLIVTGDAEVIHISTGTASDVDTVATLQPRDKIDRILGEFDRLRQTFRELVKAMPCEFGCGAARIDCVSGEGDPSQCNRRWEECLHGCGRSF